ncbi:nucleoporin p58/p45 [Mytilus galloprovincialis]|uniref:Nucleoporin p58/p45 n=2 Tax=Mytilus galloprovincialis TaxID=29158 RepID=A0A8B6FKI7_MYTGA|nr:nucleoporin p58/p45 [Mytilus galloprovincialis]
MANQPGGFNFGGPSATSSPFTLNKSATAPAAAGGFSFGAAPAAGGQSTATQPAAGGLSFGSTASTGTGGFNLGGNLAATSAPTGGFGFGGSTQPASTSTAFTLGGIPAATSATAGPTLTGLLSGNPPGSTGALGLGGVASNPAATGVSFGQTTLLGATTSAPATGLSFGAPTQPATGLTLGGLAKTTTGPTLGGIAQAKPGFSLGGAISQPTAGLGGTQQASTGFGLGGTTQPSAQGFGLGGTTQTATAGFGLGAKPPLQSGLTIGAAGINIGQATSTGSSIFGQTAAKPQVTGLGGVDPKTSAVTSGGTTTDTKPGDGKTLKASQLPPEIYGTVDEFQKYTKSEKNVQDDLARSTSKPLYKVQEDVVALRQLLSVVSNGIQRNALVVEKLKHEMTQELKNAEMSMRTKDIPPGLQYDNTAPAEYFHRLVEDFENQMLSYRQQIETLEEHLASTHQPNKLTPDDLILLLRKLHETFIALAAQLHQVHEAVKTQKEHYLNYRKIFLHDTNNIFEPEKKQQPQTRQDTSTHLGPTPFGGLTNAAAVAMASALTRSQQPAGPPVAGLAGNLGQTAGFGSTGLFGGGTTQPAAFGATTSTQPGIGGFGGFGTTTTQPAGFKGFGSGFGTTTTTQSTGFGAGFGATGGTATVRPLGFGTAITAASGFGGQSTFGQTGSLFGTAPAAAPAFGANGEPFQLNKPPTSKKKR